MRSRKLGFKSPADAVGKVVRSDLVGDHLGLMDITIIGVVGDSRFRTVRTPIEPIMFHKVRTGPGWMIIRYNGDPASGASRRSSGEWKQITTDVPFDAKFSEDIMGELYKTEDARAQIFAAFSLLAVIIGCLGLFGLAAFTAERRTKEIGIRKVLGARTRDIVRLLVWQFSRPVIIANLIAWPIAWWLMRDWLNGVRPAHRANADAVRDRRADRARDRDRDRRRPRGQGRSRQSDPRAAVRVRWLVRRALCRVESPSPGASWSSRASLLLARPR